MALPTYTARTLAYTNPRPIRSITPLKIRKDLLGPDEKAHILAAIRAQHPQHDSFIWARLFKRLPATIVKIAAEAGITLR